MRQYESLPNAAAIDRVLESMHTYPRAWGQTYDKVSWKVRDVAIREAQAEAYNQGKSEEWDITYSLPFQSVRGAVLALVAYDDCAYMLDSVPGELEILAKFGDTRAILMHTACVVFDKIKSGKIPLDE